MTSPPYWGLRDYGVGAETIWDGEDGCEHEWSFSYGEVETHHGEGSSTLTGGHNSWKRENRYSTGACVKCGAWKGQLGLEPHPSLYIQHLVAVCRELRRVLRKDGSMYLVLGDTYYGGGKGQPIESKGKMTWGEFTSTVLAKEGILNKPLSNWLTPKQKLMIPARVAIALQEDGWILRNEITWYKSNAMPESVRDRLTEKTERIYHFVKSRRYYFDLDAIRQPSKNFNVASSITRHNQPRVNVKVSGEHPLQNNPLGKNPGDVYEGKIVDIAETLSSPRARKARMGYDAEAHFYHPSGANPGDFWSINTKPFKDAHFAVFPEDLCVMPIKASCPEWICRKCGKPRGRIAKTSYEILRKSKITDQPKQAMQIAHGVNPNMSGFKFAAGRVIKNTIGWTDCGCNAGWESGVVFDPFCGSGTTCLVAAKLNRRWIGVDINADYCVMARNRLAPYTLKFDQYLA